MRVENDHPTHNGGWFHPFDSSDRQFVAPIARAAKPKQSLDDPGTMLARWQNGTNGEIKELAETLGVSELSLNELGTCYAPEYGAFVFPMSNADGSPIGFRLRSKDGSKKWSVKNSRAGLFIPIDALKRLSPRRTFICEGPTDTAACLTLGFFAIGRPSCLGCEELVATLIAVLGIRECILIVDNDAPGLRGAERLAQSLSTAWVKFVPPAKDIRAFVAAGGTSQLIEAMLSDLLWSPKK